MLESALKYAAIGLKVFPLREGLKTPATPNGFYSASTDGNIIKEWWRENPRNNIAVRTGKESGLFVLDVDCKNGKNGFLWVDANGEIPPTWAQLTPSGGHQYFFLLPEFNIFCSSDKLAQGIDIRGENGYVCVAPSKLIETETYKYPGDYEWLTDQAPDDLPLAIAPQWLLNKLFELLPIEEYHPNTSAEKIPISIKDVMSEYGIKLKEIKAGVFQGSHPVHGSSNGANFKIDTNTNLWACYRHTKNDGKPVGGSSLQLIAMMEGIICCENCKKGALRGDNFNKVLEVLKIKFKVDITTIKKEKVNEMYQVAQDIKEGALDKDYIYCIEDDKYYAYSNNYWQELIEDELALVINRKIPGINKHSLSMKNQVFGHLRVELQKRVKVFNATKCLNFPEGEYNPSTNLLSPHNKENYSTTRLSYSYNPLAKCPLWIKTLNEIFEDNQEKISALQEFLGYCLTTEMQLKKALLLLGESDTGKSTVLFAFKELIGEINYSNVSLKNMGHPQYTPMMINKLVNIDTDVDKNAADYEANFKKITAYEEIECNQKYLAAFRFRPECRIILAANDFPRITDHSSAFYNRLIILPFDRIFSLEEQDPDILSKLRVELPGIFNWCVEGYQRLKARGKFKLYDFSKDAVKELEDMNNPSSVFLDEHVEVAMGEELEKGELFQKYKEWSEINKHYTITAAMFSNCVYKRFHKHTPKKTNSLLGKRIWRNIRYVHVKLQKSETADYED